MVAEQGQARQAGRQLEVPPALALLQEVGDQVLRREVALLPARLQGQADQVLRRELARLRTVDPLAQPPGLRPRSLPVPSPIRPRP